MFFYGSKYTLLPCAHMDDTGDKLGATAAMMWIWTGTMMIIGMKAMLPFHSVLIRTQLLMGNFGQQDCKNHLAQRNQQPREGRSEYQLHLHVRMWSTVFAHHSLANVGLCASI